MIRLRPSHDRGHFDHGWLDTKHTFSFADYHDPAHMGFRTLRVINEDVVAPGQGFGTHPHRDMEIITYVLEGAVAHKDSMGNGSTIRPGEAQRMSAGSGVTHSEFNPSKTEPLHLLQIWILPEAKGIKPGYEQKTLKASAEPNRLHLAASPRPSGDAVKIHQDAELHVTVLDKGKSVEKPLAKGRHAWVQVARGAVLLNGVSMKQGDGAAVSDEGLLTLKAGERSELLLFDLA